LRVAFRKPDEWSSAITGDRIVNCVSTRSFVLQPLAPAGTSHTRTGYFPAGTFGTEKAGTSKVEEPGWYWYNVFCVGPPGSQTTRTTSFSVPMTGEKPTPCAVRESPWRPEVLLSEAVGSGIVKVLVSFKPLHGVVAKTQTKTV
jgi:hypothetical protein